ncbi:hypothetical protein BGI37_09835 [Snodgrassella alvi]|nr:hypothetical protein BGI37_09835 [Snodgrassella alvi]
MLSSDTPAKGVVVVVLDGTDGLFGLGSAVLVVAVAVSSEMQQLVTTDQVVVAARFVVFGDETTLAIVIKNETKVEITI